jgi:AAHS family 4-hydroxybenzoate transporter-like MFS transporter
MRRLAIEDRQVRRSGLAGLTVIGLLALLVTSEGFDLNLAALTAPAIGREWSASRAALTPLLTASLAGMLMGAPLLGWFGDRSGRRPAVIGAAIIFGVATFACSSARSLGELTALRAVAGLGLGGLLPNGLALAAELSPPHSRAFRTGFVANGIVLGGMAASFVASALPPDAWRLLFAVGGLLPIALAIPALAALPESPAVLIQKTAGAPAERSSASPKALFSGGLAPATIFIWLAFASSMVAIYFVTSWLPLLLQDEGVSPSRAAAIAGLFQGGGLAGGLFVSWALRPPHFAVVAAMAVLTLAAITAVGLLILGPTGRAANLLACGFALFGEQAGIAVSTTLLYPPALRCLGGGWAAGVARIGSVAGPLIGGVLVMSTQVSVARMFLTALVPVSVVLLAAIILTGWEIGGDRRRSLEAERIIPG